MSKKKNKTVVLDSPLVSELLGEQREPARETTEPPQPKREEPERGTASTETQPTLSALERETASPVEAPATNGTAPVAPALALEQSSPLLEAGPQLAPVTEAPVAQLVPLALVAPEPAVETLVVRIQKLEEALEEVRNLQGIEQRVAERVATQLQREKPTPAAAEPPVLSRAAALLDAGKSLLPSLVKADPPAAPPPPNAPVAAQRTWLLWDTIAEARAILRAYLDPRYSLSWMGRTVPLVLLAAFLLTHYWVPFAILPIVGPIIEKAVQLVVGFLLFRVLAHEARRYRQTAPDLPPSLRL
jgi:hypothetical protein